MKSPFGMRLWLLVAALLLVAGGMIYELVSALRRDQHLEARLTRSEIERFQFANEIRRQLQNQNSLLLNYSLVRDPDQWAQFDQASRELAHWMAEHDPRLHPTSPLTTATEREVFQALTSAYADYLNSAGVVHSNALPALVSSGQLAQLNAFNAQDVRLRELVRRLSDAHRTAEEAFLAEASASLASLRNILVASVGLLLILIAALGWVLYRDLIAPLRTKLVQSQSLLERQQKLATLGTLAAGIAHEIRNPLTSLKARLYTLEKHLRTVPAARKDTDIISAEIARLERIVQDVLSFARPSDPKLETAAADTLLREVQRLMAPGLESSDVKLVVAANPGLFIRADSGHLKQVLINLVRNAAEAIEGAGTVTLRACAARASLGGRETDTVILEVADTGKGISSEAEKRLFDPFFTTKETGTGLGLPIAARIVEKHGGMLQYQTTAGRGTTFGVVLPRHLGDVLQSAKNDT
jgi:signal transduction histidine kinase